MRIVGIDYGASRTGVAVSDLLGIMAHGVETIHGTNAKNVADKVIKIAEKFNAGIIVVGLPKNMNNTMGERCDATLKFIRILEKNSSCEVITWDERLSTVSATNMLNETDTRGKKRKAIIDTVAAEIILQSYLDYKKGLSPIKKEDV
jgi:putative Holliday junction resolvase